MPARSDTFTFLTASAVLVAEPHNPAIINPDFLRNKGIVPAEWEPEPNIVCTPAVAHIAYREKLSVLVEPSRCIFEEATSDAPKGEYLVHQCAEEYAKKLKYNYSALGLNWQVGLAPDNPSNWLKGRFFRPGEWRNNMALTSFAFSTPAPDSAVCNFTLRVLPQPTQASFEPIAMVLDCNFHFDLKGVLEKTARISDILAHRQEQESFLVQSIDKYLIKDLV